MDPDDWCSMAAETVRPGRTRVTIEYDRAGPQPTLALTGQAAMWSMLKWAANMLGRYCAAEGLDGLATMLGELEECFAPDRDTLN